MRNSILILILTNLFICCNSQTDKKLVIIDSKDSSSHIFANKKLERYFPEKKAIVIFDTIIIDRQIQITIKRTDLDSYVLNEYEEDGFKQMDKYRDAEIALTIKRKSQILLDTVFRKEQFLRHTDQGFIDIAIFHNYWLNSIDRDKISLFGVISKPESDVSLAFNHYFDLTSRKLKFVEQSEEEE